MLRIDLNCDVGESFGVYHLGSDEEVIRHITSANIACGYHAGDPATMRKLVRLCLENSVGIGAHPGLPDLHGFGRRAMDITPQDAYDMTLYQIGALSAFVQAEGGTMRHVKPHGALYNMAAANGKLASAIAEAVYRMNPELILIGLSGSELVKAGQHAGLRTASEVFADRKYQADGSLTSRQDPGAVIQDVGDSLSQVTRMVLEGKVSATQGLDITIQADTLCIHGDHPGAASFAKHIREHLATNGVSVQCMGET